MNTPIKWCPLKLHVENSTLALDRYTLEWRYWTIGNEVLYARRIITIILDIEVCTICN